MLGHYLSCQICSYVKRSSMPMKPIHVVVCFLKLSIILSVCIQNLVETSRYRLWRFIIKFHMIQISMKKWEIEWQAQNCEILKPISMLFSAFPKQLVTWSMSIALLPWTLISSSKVLWTTLPWIIWAFGFQLF
jgi:hypothetical protein